MHILCYHKHCCSKHSLCAFETVLKNIILELEILGQKPACTGPADRAPAADLQPVCLRVAASFFSADASDSACSTPEGTFAGQTGIPNGCTNIFSLFLHTSAPFPSLWPAL